jgi:hypothetical protein
MLALAQRAVEALEQIALELAKLNALGVARASGIADAELIAKIREKVLAAWEPPR